MPASLDTLPDIRDLLPHSGTMVLLEKVLEVGAEYLCAEAVIRPDSLFCNAEGVGSWVGIEYMAQAIAAYAGYAARLRSEPVKIGFLLGTRRYEAATPCFPIGSVLRVRVQRTLQVDNGIGSFECQIHQAQRQLACATITVFQPKDAAGFLEGSTE